MQRRVVDAFLAAARSGDFDALLRVLDPDVVLRIDGQTRGDRLEFAADFRRGLRASGGQASRALILRSRRVRPRESCGFFGFFNSAPR